MKRMDAGGYAACFDHQQLALLCANSDRTIDRLGAENKQLTAENKELRTLCEDMLDYSRGAGFDNMAEWFRDRIDALGLVG